MCILRRLNTVYLLVTNSRVYNEQITSIAWTTMAFLHLRDLAFSPYFLLVVPAVVLVALFARIIYNLYFHPLANYRGPWYACSFSLFDALVSVRKVENHWLMSLTEKYGWDKPIRIAPNMLLVSKLLQLFHQVDPFAPSSCFHDVC